MIMIFLQLEINFINVIYGQVFVKYWKPILFLCSSQCEVWAIEILPEKRLCWRHRLLVVTATACNSGAGREQAAIDTKAMGAMSRAPLDQRLHPSPSSFPRTCFLTVTERFLPLIMSLKSIRIQMITLGHANFYTT